MKKAPLAIGIIGSVVGWGLVIAGMASNGFHSCGSGGTYKGDPEPTNPCPHSLELLVVVGIIIFILGILMAIVANAVICRRSQARTAPPVGVGGQSGDPFGS